MATVTVQEERRIELRWVKDGKGWRQILYPEQINDVISRLRADGWCPSPAEYDVLKTALDSLPDNGVADNPARHTPGDYLERVYLKNGKRFRSTVQNGYVAWVPVEPQQA